jgi:MurNAc alpha-1-phosphate uridylyltransferase
MSAEPAAAMRPYPDRAMVLAAGLGTRMRPITDRLPKPLVKVGGRPLIDHILDAAAAAAVREAVVNVHHLAPMMEAHLAGRSRPRIHISDEREALLDSGGGVLKALPLLGEAPFWVFNADAIWIDGPQSNLVRLAQAFDPARMDVLILCASTATAIGWGNRGDFAMEQDGRLRWPAPREVTPFAYAGAGIWKPELFADRPPVFSLRTIFDEAAAAGRLYGLRLDGIWMHVGTPDAIRDADEAVFRSAR